MHKALLLPLSPSRGQKDVFFAQLFWAKKKYGIMPTKKEGIKWIFRQ